MVLKLALYVSGPASVADAEVAALRKALDQRYASGYELRVCDILEHFEDAFDHDVIATPTLVKVSPPPTRHVIGSFGDAQRLVAGLDPAGGKP